MRLIVLFFFLGIHTSVFAQEGIAVVELFTSQGCSSCPSADRLLTDLIEEAQAENKQLFPLSFHVSYWNYLGWKDPYSSDQYTQRQQLYASRLRLNNIYTPQMVVNGQYEFVGSNGSEARSTINLAREDESLVELKLEEVSREEGEIKFNFDWDGPLTGYVLNIALVERSIENYVPRGENHGKTLKHDNVVRYFNTYNSAKEGSLSVDLPDDINLDNCSVVIYAQQKREWQIVGATALAL